MIKRSSLLRLISSLFCALAAFLVLLLGHNGPEGRGEEEGNALAALRWYNDQRAYPTGSIPADWRERAMQQIAIAKNSRSVSSASSVSSVSWTSVGPSNIAGRIRSIAIDPTNHQVVYCGSVSGGIWKSTDGGGSWTALTDVAPNLVIGTIAIDPSNHNIVYAGTGEGYYNVDALRGVGILKSTDGGASWSVIGKSSFTSADTNSTIYYINKIAIRPDKPDTLFAAVSAVGTGIWRSYNGGLTWSRVTVSTMTPKFCTDIVIDPVNPDNMYAAFGLFYADGVYKSSNGGKTWSKLTSGFPLASSGYRRISLAIAQSDPAVLYACLSDSNYYTHSIQKSTDGGASWTSLAAPVDNSYMVAGTHLGGQGWYNNIITVDPTNSSVVYTGGINLFKSTNGGAAWNRLSDGYGTPYVHVDQHAIVIDPADNLTIYFGNDGGMWKSTDGGLSFQNLNTGLVTTQFYAGAVAPSGDVWYGGTQDNGTLKSAGSSSWTQVLGGDGGATLVDFANPSTVYGEYPYLALQKSLNSGNAWSPALGNGANSIPYNASSPQQGTTDRCAFIAPLVMDASNAQILYAGTYRLYRSSDGGIDWSSISGDLTGDGTGANEPRGITDKSVVTAIGLSKTSPSTIYSGSSGSAYINPKVFVTTDLGSHWTEITKVALPKRTVTSIAVDPNTRDHVFVTYSGYGGGHVFSSSNRGGTWVNISSDLPDIPVNNIVIDPEDVTHLLVATDVGVFATNNGGSAWALQSSGLPNVAVNQLVLRQDGILFAATHGRGMYRSVAAISTPSPIEIIIHQNTALTKYIDLYVAARESLSVFPALLVSVGGTGTPVVLVQQANRFFKGSYTFPVTGSYSVQASSADSLSQPVSATRTFGVILAKPGAESAIASADSTATLRVPAGAVTGETWCTLIPEKTENVPGGSGVPSWSFGPETGFNAPVEIALKYRSEDLEANAVPVIYRATAAGWVTVPGILDESARVVRASVSSLGRFAIGTAAAPSGPGAIPLLYRLEPNFPNPFNPSTTIRYDLAASADVTIRIFDVAGRCVRTIENGIQGQGVHDAMWDGTGNHGEPVASGVYFTRLTLHPVTGGAWAMTRKMLLIR
jgi:photosystem II stability/assembly factor-like uncharacterized protein